TRLMLGRIDERIVGFLVMDDPNGVGAVIRSIEVPDIGMVPAIRWSDFSGMTREASRVIRPPCRMTRIGPELDVPAGVVEELDPILHVAKFLSDPKACAEIELIGPNLVRQAQRSDWQRPQGQEGAQPSVHGKADGCQLFVS